MGDFTRIQAKDGRSFEAYLALPTPTHGIGPGLVVLPEIFNVNETVRGVVDSYAAEGFVALAPDMFWRSEPGLHMTYSRENSQRGLALYGTLDRGLAVEDVGQCVAALRQRQDVNGKVGVMGFCMGGEITLLAGCRLPVDAAVIYYGTRMEPHLDEMTKLGPPTVMHFAELDPHVPMATVEAISARVAGLAHVAVYVYEGADHAFARINHPQFHAAAADLAQQRTRQLLRQMRD
jgi:carboxymethylenebutenolidase